MSGEIPFINIISLLQQQLKLNMQEVRRNDYNVKLYQVPLKEETPLNAYCCEICGFNFSSVSIIQGCYCESEFCYVSVTSFCCKPGGPIILYPVPCLFSSSDKLCFRVSLF